MRHWPLRLKLTAWSALLTGLLLLICAIGTALYVREEQIEALDGQLHNEAHTFFAEVSRQADHLDWKHRKAVEEILPRMHTTRFVEVYGAEGQLLFHRGPFPSGALAGRPDGVATAQLGETSVRLAVSTRHGLRLCLGAALSEINADASEVRRVLGVGLPAGVAIMAAGGWWLARKALAPMRELTDAVEQITVRHLRHRLPALPGNDEVARLSSVLNGTFDRLDASFRQAVRFTADASHELKTPLAVMRALIENLLESRTLRPADRAETAALLEQTRRLTGIIESLLLLAHADAGQLTLDRQETDLCELITACAEDASIFAQPRRIALRLTLPETLPAFVDPARVTQILLNLLINAVKYNTDGGDVQIEANRDAEGPIIRIRNTGAGIPPEAQPLLFERFYRAHASGDSAGHGLGLSLARELARAHQGDVTLESSDEHQTVFAIRLAAAASSGAKPSHPAAGCG